MAKTPAKAPAKSPAKSAAAPADDAAADSSAPPARKRAAPRPQKATAAAETAPAKKTTKAPAKAPSKAPAKRTAAVAKKSAPTIDEPVAVEDPATEAAEAAPTDAPPPTEIDVEDHAGDDPVANAEPARRAVAEAEPIDLLAHAGPAVAKRVVGPATIALIIILGVWRRRRHHA